MRVVLFGLYLLLTAVLLLGAGVRVALLLSVGADLDGWTIGVGVIGLVALIGLLAAGPGLWRSSKR